MYSCRTRTIPVKTISATLTLTRTNGNHDICYLTLNMWSLGCLLCLISSHSNTKAFTVPVEQPLHDVQLQQSLYYMGGFGGKSSVHIRCPISNKRFTPGVILLYYFMKCK